MKSRFTDTLECFIEVYEKYRPRHFKRVNSVKLTSDWFLTKQPDLGNKPPNYFLITGRIDELKEYINNYDFS